LLNWRITVDEQSKSIFKSKTFWTAILSPVVAWVGGHVFHAQPDTINVITETLATMTPVIIGLRMASDGAVHVIPK
jgi:hypothetical protein